jgi:hypothetical protein
LITVGPQLHNPQHLKLQIKMNHVEMENKLTEAPVSTATATMALGATLVQAR